MISLLILIGVHATCHSALDIDIHKLDFAGVEIDTVKTLPLTIRSNHAPTYNLRTQVLGAMFLQKKECPPRLGESEWCVMEIGFAPASAWSYVGEIRIFEQNELTHVIAMTGTGLAANLLFLNPQDGQSTVITALRFNASVLKQDSASQVLRVKNIGNYPASLPKHAVKVPLPFILTKDQCSLGQLAPMMFCDLSIAFHPTQEIEYRGDQFKLSLDINGHASLELPLIGRGSISSDQTHDPTSP